LSRITAALRVDVGRCSASKAPNPQSATANATANSKIFFAADLECATTFPRLHDVITTCAEQPQPSAFWKRYERDAPSPQLRTTREGAKPDRTCDTRWAGMCIVGIVRCGWPGRQSATPTSGLRGELPATLAERRAGRGTRHVQPVRHRKPNDRRARHDSTVRNPLAGA